MEQIRRLRSHEIEEHQPEVLAELMRLAEPHIASSGGLFVALDIDHETYPAQSLTTHRIEGDPQDVAVVDLIAKSVEPRFSFFTDELERHEQETGHISKIIEAFDEGHNIVLVTNHSDIKDIAYTLAAYYIKLKEHGAQDMHTSLVMSKIISLLGVKVGEHTAPAADILKNLCDDQYFSFPRTKTIAGSHLKKSVVDTYNHYVNSTMRWNLRSDRRLFAMAASGTTDKPLADNPDIYLMHGVTKGTTKLMQGKKTLVVPVAIWVDGEKMLFEPVSDPQPVDNNDPDGGHKVMRSIAHLLTQRIEGKSFIYQYPDVTNGLGHTALTDPS